MFSSIQTSSVAPPLSKIWATMWCNADNWLLWNIRATAAVTTVHKMDPFAECYRTPYNSGAFFVFQCSIWPRRKLPHFLYWNVLILKATFWNTWQHSPSLLQRKRLCPSLPLVVFFFLDNSSNSVKWTGFFLLIFWTLFWQWPNVIILLVIFSLLVVLYST